MKEIKLSQGKVALVDDEDFEYLSRWKWSLIKAKHNYYADNEKLGLMHRIIIKTPAGLMTDHIDHNGLNNQKSNLRICTNAQNLMNRKSRGASKYLGVNILKVKKNNKEYLYYTAGISVNNKNIYLGCFKNEESAALKYNEAAKKYHREFANLNIIS